MVLGVMVAGSFAILVVGWASRASATGDTAGLDFGLCVGNTATSPYYIGPNQGLCSSGGPTLVYSSNNDPYEPPPPMTTPSISGGTSLAVYVHTNDATQGGGGVALPFTASVTGPGGYNFSGSYDSPNPDDNVAVFPIPTPTAGGQYSITINTQQTTSGMGAPNTIGPATGTGPFDVTVAPPPTTTTTTTTTTSPPPTTTTSPPPPPTSTTTSQRPRPGSSHPASKPTPTVTTTRINSRTIYEGQSASDSAMVTGHLNGAAPTGMVTFYWCHTTSTISLPTPCNATSSLVPLVKNKLTKVTNSNVATISSGSIPVNATGTYCFFASYGGDNRYQPSSDNSTNNECFTATGITSSTIKTQTSVGVAVARVTDGISDTATVVATSTKVGEVPTAPTGLD